MPPGPLSCTGSVRATTGGISHRSGAPGARPPTSARTFHCVRPILARTSLGSRPPLAAARRPTAPACGRYAALPRFPTGRRSPAHGLRPIRWAAPSPPAPLQVRWVGPPGPSAPPPRFARIPAGVDSPPASAATTQPLTPVSRGIPILDGESGADGAALRPAPNSLLRAQTVGPLSVLPRQPPQHIEMAPAPIYGFATR